MHIGAGVSKLLHTALVHPSGAFQEVWHIFKQELLQSLHYQVNWECAQWYKNHFFQVS
jgi:hypothetical protein